MNNRFSLDKIGLPASPSKGLRMCLEDLEVCAQNPDYAVFMDFWHEPLVVPDDDSLDGRCGVCLGGARLARFYDDHVISRDPGEIQDINERLKINSMNEFRQFRVEEGLKMYLGLSQHDDDLLDGKFTKMLVDIPGWGEEYYIGENFGKWLKTMYAVADVLEAWERESVLNDFGGDKDEW